MAAPEQKKPQEQCLRHAACGKAGCHEHVGLTGAEPRAADAAENDEVEADGRCRSLGKGAACVQKPHGRRG